MTCQTCDGTLSKGVCVYVSQTGGHANFINRHPASVRTSATLINLINFDKSNVLKLAYSKAIFNNTMF
jgi:hypothetical protein